MPGGIFINNDVTNYGGVPSAGAGLLANRPAAGVVGRLFIGTDTNIMYRDTGSTWVTIGSSGPSGSGAAGQATFWTGASAISGDNAFFWDNTNKRLGLGTTTPGVRLDVHGTGVIAQLNGTTTNSSFLDFQNAGTTQWRIGNNYNAGNRLFQIVDQVGTNNAVTINNNRQIGFNLPGTSFFSTNWGYQFHFSSNTAWDFSLMCNNASGIGGYVNQGIYCTRNNTYGSYSATQTGEQLFQTIVWGSGASSYLQAAFITYTQNGSVSTTVPTDISMGAYNAAGVVTRLNTRAAGFSEATGRFNIAGATDNSLFELNVNGNTYTGGLSPTILTVSGNTTMARTVTGYYCTATLTLTLPSAASINNVYWVIAGPGATITVNRAGTDDILNLAGTSVTSITISPNQRAMFYVGGGTRTFLISQA